MIGRDEVMRSLNGIIDPCSAANGTNFGLVDMGMVEDVAVEGGDVRIALRITFPGCWMLEYLLTESRRRVGALPSVTSVEVEADDGFQWDASMMNQERRREYLEALRRSLPVLE
jgi:metal-sulfur cluster biosynthetic enzyme